MRKTLSTLVHACHGDRPAGLSDPGGSGGAIRQIKPEPAKARVPVAADDQVVVDGDAERLADLDDRLRHLDVGARRRRVAGGVVVDEDDGGRGKLQRAADHLARIDRRVVDRAGLLHLVGDQRFFLSRKRMRNCSRSSKAMAVRQ